MKLIIIPNGTLIAANAYLVFVKDESDFTAVFPQITNYIGEIGFGFGGSDSVRLYNASGVLQDEVTYLNDAPWPICADETGNTLELITPDLDNSLPGSWSCINIHGSPNAVNNSSLSIDNVYKEPVKAYPNPVQNTLYISGVKGPSKIKVYSVLGQLVMNQSITNTLDVSRLKRGVYYIKISDSEKTTQLNFIKY